MNKVTIQGQACCLGTDSAKIFGLRFKYDSLFSKASQNSSFKLLTDTDQALFTIFGTENFEMILNVLAASKAISVALNQDDNCELLQDHENRIRKALIQAVHSVHIFSCV
ncbi:MAG: DUF4917 family protein [Synechococcus sp. SB0678_bin_12]|nr:DUF4917 family protein [Synechococcus sp. SB0678_bin_12]MYI87835.1 DUF4917 family protein [Synechococcus sp. SB0672_bin_10]